MSTACYRSWVEISRDRIAENYRAVRAMVGAGVEVMPVVKADAYRHGAIEVSRVLQGEGARWLAVSNTEEGVALRQAGITAQILVMADFLPPSRAAFIEFNLTPVLHAVEDLEDLQQLAERYDRTIACHLKIDSGMGRLGTRAPAAEAFAVLRKCPRVSLDGLMTHFASVTDFGRAKTEEQIGYFEEWAAALGALGYQPRWIHLASTGAIAFGRRRAWGNLVRPGHAIYGYASPARGPAPERLLEVKPALVWKAAVLAVKDIPAGAEVGYGGMFQAARPMRIAILAAGYADGIPHRYSNRGKVLVNGREAAVLGAVSMDITTIDASRSPELRAGDAVTLLGREGSAGIDAQEMARVAGTISYSVLCGISARVRRVYL